MCVYIYIYIYICCRRGRGVRGGEPVRDSMSDVKIPARLWSSPYFACGEFTRLVSLYIYIYIYIYVYVYVCVSLSL